MTYEWREVELGEVVDLLTGYPFKSQHYTDDSEAPRLLRGDNVAQGWLRWDSAKRWPGTMTSDLDDYWLSEGDVILAMDRPWIDAGLKYAAVGGADLPSLLVQRVARLRGSESFDTRFLRYLIASRAFTNHVLAVQTGTAVPHISGGQIKSFRFLRPPLPVQRAIAHILGTLDDKIERNRRMNETLEAIARAIFKSWFVDFDPVRAKAEGRQPYGMDAETAALFPDAFDDSTLGKIPKGWRVATLGDVVDVVKGRSYSSSELADSETALVSLKSFQRGGGYRPDGLKPFTGSYKPEQAVIPGELVLAYTDVTQAADVIGKPAIVRRDARFKTLVASLDVGIIRPATENVSVPFLYCLCRTDDFQDHTYAHSTGTTVLHLSKDAVPSFLFPCPPAEVGRAFRSVTNALFEKIDANEQESATLSALRDTLLPKLMSGELRVNDAERIAARAK